MSVDPFASEPVCFCCGDRGWTVRGHLSDGTAEQIQCECCEEAYAAEQAGEQYVCATIASSRQQSPADGDPQEPAA